MNTDRELLELAAKAAGIELPNPVLRITHHRGVAPKTWNPLTDDGDALRLAVMLRLCYLWQHDWLMVYSGDVGVRERELADPYVATRRAIVRAAAEIGKAMP